MVSCRHLLLLFALTLLPIVSIQAEEDAENAEFIKITDSIDLNNPKNTSLSIKTNWANLQGREVTWTATVVDVEGGRGKAVIYAEKGDKPLYKGYNLILTSFDEMGAGKLRKGDIFTFKGLYENKKQRKGGPLALYINSVQIIAPK